MPRKHVFAKCYIEGDLGTAGNFAAQHRRLIKQRIEMWRESDRGRFVREHSPDVKVHQEFDVARYQTIVAIVGSLDEKHETFYFLKWPAKDNISLPIS